MFLLLRALKISSRGARKFLAPQEQEPPGKQGLKLPSAGEENWIQALNILHKSLLIKLSQTCHNHHHSLLKGGGGTTPLVDHGSATVP